MPSLRSNIRCAVSLGAAVLLSPSTARAHFVLHSPQSWSVVAMGGAPEKVGPCGNEGNPVLQKDDAGQPVVTTYQEGQMITISLSETTSHPGHYRVALSLNWATAGDTALAGFPPDPTPTPGPTNSGSKVCLGAVMSGCGSIPVVTQTPAKIPEGWILGDNLNEHCGVMPSATFQVQLPPGVTCKECVLQVIEFMSDHGPPCFYHHCANISIQSAGTGPSDASTPSDATVEIDASSTGSVSSGSASSGTDVSSTGSASASGTSVTSGSPTTSGVSASGSSVSSGSASPASGSAPAAASSNSSGCSVSAPGGARGAMVLAWLAAAAGTVLARRRRRPKRSSAN